MTDAATRASLNQQAVRTLAARLRGELVQPTDDGYDEARAVWNGMIDRRPALIARCADVADVITVVDYARDDGWLLAVRGGGHNVSGNGVCDAGLVLDLARMNGVEVDAGSRTVRAEGGVTIGQLDRATQPYGLAVPQGVVTETGIAGLTLGGGLGWLRRKHGLSCDNLVSVELVTAGGEQVRASEQENPELFWGLRGGGGNFGVATAFEFRAHPVGPEVFFTLVFHSGTDAPAALRFYREWEASTPDDVSAFAILMHAPAIEDIPAEHHHRPVVAFAALHAGDPTEGEQALASLRAFGAPIADLSAVTPYLEVQQLFDEDYPAHELRYYWKSLYLSGLDDDAVDLLVALNERSPSPHSTFDLWQLGGALARVGADDTAFGDRSAPFLLGIEANWEEAADDEANIAWAREAYTTMQPFSTGGEYLNFPGFYEGGERTLRTSFGPNYERLVALKRAYDPTNLFRLNQNISPLP